MTRNICRILNVCSQFSNPFEWCSSEISNLDFFNAIQQWNIFIFLRCPFPCPCSLFHFHSLIIASSPSHREMSRGIYQSQGICIPLFTGAPVSFRPLSVQNYPINSAITSLLLSCLVERQVLVFSHCHGVASSIRNSREWVVCQECQQVSSLGCVTSKILVRDEHKFDGRGPVKIHTVVRVEFKSTRTSYTGIFTSVLLSDSRLSCVHQQYIYLNISFHCKWTNCTEKAKVKAEIDFICRNGNGLMKKKIHSLEHLNLPLTWYSATVYVTVSF